MPTLSISTPSLSVRTFPEFSGLWFSFHIDKEGVFIFVVQVELALLWSGVQD
jgi:hypothetical protein